MLATIASLVFFQAVAATSDEVVPIYETQTDPVEKLPQIELLYVYDIASHGSTYPETNITGLEHESDKKKMGKLTPFGERQNYLRGKEMRKRLITQSAFMKPLYNHDEFQAWSLNDETSIKSAQAYLTGFYGLDEEEYFAGLPN